MVRSFIPQGINSSIVTNTNFPPQSRVSEGVIPPEGGSALVQTGTLIALVQTGTLIALVQTDNS